MCNLNKEYYSCSTVCVRCDVHCVKEKIVLLQKGKKKDDNNHVPYASFFIFQIFFLGKRNLG